MESRKTKKYNTTVLEATSPFFAFQQKHATTAPHLSPVPRPLIPAAMYAHFNHEDGSLPLLPSTTVDEFSALVRDLATTPSLGTKQRLMERLMALLSRPDGDEERARFDRFAPWVVAFATMAIRSDATLDRFRTRAETFTTVEYRGQAYVLCMYSPDPVNPFHDLPPLAGAKVLTNTHSTE